ncbi:hypothetical protein [Nitrospira sp. M1]
MRSSLDKASSGQHEGPIFRSCPNPMKKRELRQVKICYWQAVSSLPA